MAKKQNSALIRRDNHSLARRVDALEARIAPAVDIFETPVSFILHVDMPGADRDTLSVSVDARRLEVSGSISPLHDDNVRIHLQEIMKKSYYRTFNLLPGLDSAKIEAEFENGVLTIVVPKSEHTRTKTIPIK